MTREPIFNVQNVNHYFGERESRRQVLFDNSIAIESGEIAILTGPSGSGKTTLLTLIGALRSVQDGSVNVLGRELRGLDLRSLARVRRDIGFIFQFHNLFESLTAVENVMMALELKPGSRVERERRAKEILDRVGLGHRMHAKPDAMSGGQRQRVSIARALVNGPRLILADEPTAALDKDSGSLVIELFEELSRQDQCAVLIVTHDNRILHAAHRIVNMVDGRIVSDVYVNESVEICEFLMQCPVFERLGATALSDIADKMRRQKVPAGTTVIRQGDEGDEFFLIRAGAVDVYREAVGTRSHRATMKAGEFFGEVALMTGEPRNATVVAATDCEFYVLARAHFQRALESSANFKEQVVRVLFHRQ